MFDGLKAASTNPPTAKCPFFYKSNNGKGRKVSLKHLTQCRSPVSRGTAARSQAIFVEILANSPYYVSYLSYTGFIVSATHRQAAAVRGAAANRLSSSFRRHKYHHMEQRPAGHRPRTVRSTADNRLRDKRR